MTISSVIVTDASDYSPGFVYVRWQADRQAGVVIRVDGQEKIRTQSYPGYNAGSILPLSAGTHTICVEEE